ncbi:MAG: NYN domain-containing protein [Nitrososphaerota archaeon]|nr:NYN domain-containing protein [Nitrososphaerota archaeon]
MSGDSSDRVVVFIDGSNLVHTAQFFREGYRIDYAKLRDKAVNGRRLLRVYFFGSVPPNPNQGQIKFHTYLRAIGFTLELKPLHVHNGKFVEKGVDVALVTKMLGSLLRSNAFSVAVVVSGDNDMTEAIREVKGVGKRVEVMAFRNGIGKQLREEADEFFAIDDFASEVELAPKSESAPVA